MKSTEQTFTQNGVETAVKLAQAFAKMPDGQAENATLYIKGVVAGFELAANSKIA